METVIPAIIVTALLLLAAFTIADRFLSTQEAVSEAWRAMEKRATDRKQSDLSSVDVTTTILGDAVEITAQNSGDTKFADFDRWDVILQYTGSDGYRYAEWYPLGAGQNEWVKVIADVTEPGILNPGETMTIEVSVSPAVGNSSTNIATVSAPNGICTTAVFTH